MRILDICINNFRGIDHFSHSFSSSNNLICIIGKNDSGKSSLLRAVEWLFYPTNALNVSISDFYKCDITNSIAIEATFTDFPEAFLLPDKYGRYLTKPGKKEAPRPRTFPENSKVQSSSDDVIGGRSWKEIETFREPEDSNHLYLRARLTISSSFDPEWTIVSDAQEPTFFRQSDRKVLNVSSIGLDCRKDLAWGQGSVLRKYYSGSDLKSDLKHLSVKALQSASIGEADVSKPLDEALSNIPQILNKYGVSLSGELSNHLDFKNADSSILVFEGEKSLSSRGLGSQRLTSIALNLETKINKTLVLIDEIETSLEPFRIRTLISLLRDRVKDNGQIIFTTHSPITLDSCKFDEVFILQTTEEDDRLYSVGSLCDTDDLQKAFRRFNKCLLGRKIIICEGHTEFELIKAIDSYFFNRNNSSLACYGVDYIDGNGGSNSSKIASLLIRLGYTTCVVMDSDKPCDVKKVKEVQDIFSSFVIFQMDDGNCIENQIANDAPESFIRNLPSYLQSNDLFQQEILNSLEKKIEIMVNDRAKLGDFANQNKIFKSYRCAEILFPLLFESFNENGTGNSTFEKLISGIIKWIK